ncbi:threonine/serine exporter family protein [Enhydrobacter sp.]|jgi:uncharacterized membrane protein YjjP (DUF1212 family)|uniref:threonine/serine exporter family protein n=1 Tax=Enhydrobacter sp. TaxID=1894999 RepID=UPI002625C7E3|nr:threonine/serine exporter family protein [Enhydrobacter sp.]WIM09107.1 MAG: hypothetical protein OJF58_000058 [Enhydrobacter sp.]
MADDVRSLRARQAREKTSAAADGALALALEAATLLFANGQTTERVILAVERLASALGCHAGVFPQWGQLNIWIYDARGSHEDARAALPTGVDMGKVTATLDVIDGLCDGRLAPDAARSRLAAVAALPPVPLARFALMAAVGAAAFGVIFGGAHPASLAVMAFSAGAGACLRRWLAGFSRGPFLQPFSAALLAGFVGAVAIRLGLGTALHLVALCPCMVLVPGPHFLNGALDLVRLRIPLGLARLAYALMVVLMISAGLLAGLTLGGSTLSVSGPPVAVPLVYEVVAAGVAVAAIGTFFAIPWRALPVPILIGMLAHAARWTMMAVGGAGVVAAALAACLVIGGIATPIADRMRLPFPALAFVSAVSLIPGVYLFRAAGGIVGLVALAGKAAPDLAADTLADGATAFMIVLAMVFGLVFPRVCLESRRLARKTKSP